MTRPDLIEHTVATTPAAPVRAPGTTFSVTDTDAECRGGGLGAVDDPLLPVAGRSEERGRHAAGREPGGAGLAAGASHSGTVTVTIPAATPLNNYVLLACADDLSTVVETNEGNNSLAASGSATVTVTRPDLLEDTVSTRRRPRRAGTTFSVTDTARNAGAVASGLSTTRYYLSLDGVKNAGDTLLVGTRAVPGLAAGRPARGRSR